MRSGQEQVGREPGSGRRRNNRVATLLKVFAAAVLFGALVIRPVLFEVFTIPSGSMKPALLVGDFVLVSKYSYGFTPLPRSPPWFGAPPDRGDVVVFRLPNDDSVDYIKRVIGLPGDRIKVVDGLVFINGKAVRRRRIDDFSDDEDGVAVPRWRETLPNGASYETLGLQDGPFENTDEYQVPPGHFFMMGDNRDNSEDSRVLSAVGYVPFENLIGKAQVVFFSVSGSTSDRGRAVRWHRLFTIVR
jgi:signal peptidase I